jgi:anhydro-N-acetylmuramic acid kinase
MRPVAKRSMVVAGVMSGTSADGIDVALVKISRTSGNPKIKLLAHHSVSYPPALRRSVLAAMDAKQTSTAELARLNWRLGMAYAEAVDAAVAKHGVKLDLVGCHGQTVYHQAKPAAYAGRDVACTWQLGEPALIAAMLRVPVVSNFRPADMAAGGQGAPLVPLLDYVLFAHKGRMRVLQNIGGIGNLTAIPANSGAEKVIAFDTGPGNMVIDALMEWLFQGKFDRDGRVAGRGQVLDKVVKRIVSEKYFAMKPPKSAGREQFGASFAAEFFERCKKAGAKPEDAVATATALTAESIVLAYRRFVRPLNKTGSIVDYVVSGGGARNATLIEMLRGRLKPMGCRVVASDQMGLPSQAKEAVAFALLAWQTWHGLTGNVPSATGAKRPVVLGEICYG